MSPTQIHKWEPTGVTAYPITHPIVGQTDFYRKLKHWLPLVAGDRFAHVFAMVAPWGVGKSRLGYEVVAQVNDASCGWKVRGEDGGLTDARLFDNDAEREKHLALYIRYSQVADRRLNLDNWFAPAVYKALVPLARGQFDDSIQHRIAKQSFDRLEAEGFDPDRLAAAMELQNDHGDAIYTDTALATRLCNAAFAVLKDFGIEYVIVVLDELETAAERATGGMEAEEARAMDGKSITMLRKAVELLGRADIEMMSKAVKEEDARARFPWLRFVALCSPAIGDELKEVQSTDRRFEIVDLSRNAFADVSTFVHSLESEGRLLRSYPKGLVEAAYMMSGANFGWFNVIMAVVDQVLARVPEGETPSLSWVFQRAIEIQERIGRYVLDHRSLDEIPLQGGEREIAADLLFGQQPRPVNEVGDDQARRLIETRNAYGEPVAAQFHCVTWRPQACAQTLVQNRFQRISGSSRWTAPGIPEPIDLERLLDDLATMAVHEQADGDGAVRLLLPTTLPGFLQLLDLVHPHPAAEETGRTLWMKLVGTGSVPNDSLTHIGPSVEMLRRLDIRLRKASVGSMLRDPDENEALTRVLDTAQHSEAKRALRVLTGALRVLDRNWGYDAEPAGLGDDVVAIKTPKEGLIDFKGLWLHPKGQVALAWVTSDESLQRLANAVLRDHRKAGRYPVVALTTDYELPERFEKSLDSARKARDSIVVVHLNSGEEAALLSVGLPSLEWQGFRLRAGGFTTRFAERLNRIRNPIAKRIREWRQDIGARGHIAWPVRPNGTLKPESLKRLVSGWAIVMLHQSGKKLGDVGAIAGLDHAALLQDIERLGHSPAAAPKGYGSDEAARLWVDEGPEAHPEVPPFLVRCVALRLFNNANQSLAHESVKADWFWGFTWDGNRTSDIFREWLTVAVDLGWAEVDTASKSSRKTQYVFVPREALHGKLAAARRWLDEDYPRIVEDLSRLLGEDGPIRTWFKPTAGSKYQRAVQRLDEAAQALEELDALETNPPNDDELAETHNWFVRATKLRLRIRYLVAQVFDKQGYDELQADLDGHTLQLTDEERPLWKRIGQAKHFADAVQILARRIRTRIPSLGEEMRREVAGIRAFPINLFVRPLSKIDHIVDAGLTGEDPKCTTKRVQHAKPDTLAYYLKELRVADAMAAIRSLAGELGVGERPADDVSLRDIDGDIVSGFRDLVDRYGTARKVLENLTNRVLTLEDALEGAPSDFSAPTVALSDVSGRPALIDGVLAQSLEDDVEDMLERHDAEMNYGRFGPLMREARTKLLDNPERALKGLEGKVRTLENAVTAYRQELLEDETLRAHHTGLNGLRRGRGEASASLPTMSDLESRSLKEGRIYVDGVAAGWAKDGTALLGRTGVTFDEWLQVAKAVADDEDPALTGTKLDALVAEGLLRRIYALAGGEA